MADRDRLIGRDQRRVRLDDVAREAAVSKALVSLVINDRPGPSEATRARVLQVVREMGYRPDVRARALSGQTSRLIGVMFGVGVGQFHFDLLDGLYAASETSGHILVLAALTRGRDERRVADSLNDFRFHAAVMIGPQSSMPLLAGEVPLVVLGWKVDHPEVDVVRTSDEAGMLSLIAHLTQLGHRRIAHIDGGNNAIGELRRNAYIAAMQKHGLGDQVRIVAGGETQLDGQRAARVLLGHGTLPSAVICFNDDAATATVGLFVQEGVDVPGQISVTGWDDSDAARLSPVALTTIAQDPMAMGRLALARVVDRVDGTAPDSREVLLEPRLRIRASTGPVAI